MALDLTSFDAGLKIKYPRERVEYLGYKDHPLLATLPKMETFGGKRMDQPVHYGNPQNTSVSFATAKENRDNTGGNSQIDDFLITRVKEYSFAFVDNETILASKGSEHAFMEAAGWEIDNSIESLARSVAYGLYGDGGGTIGQGDGSYDVTTGQTITLSQAEDIVKFEVGMRLNAVTAATGGTVRTAVTSVVTVASVDRSAGTFDIEEASADAGIAAIVNTDFFVPKSNYDARVKGLAAWLPETAPTSGDSFFGLDRSVDATRLAGVRVDGQTGSPPILDTVQDLASQIGREGGAPDHAFVSFEQYRELEKALDSLVRYDNVQVGTDKGFIGFRALVVAGPRGPIKILQDKDCPVDRIYMLTLNTWKLASLGMVPHIFDTDGRSMLRESDNDGLEIRSSAYYQLVCRKPAANGMASLVAP